MCRRTTAKKSDRRRKDNTAAVMRLDDYNATQRAMCHDTLQERWGILASAAVTATIRRSNCRASDSTDKKQRPHMFIQIFMNIKII